ncbi:MAG: hypothetical protein IIB81_02710 [Nanoarchaeota archaeon]|nr:hypothetical protein [Nanoarchaeota archaeon]
MYYQEGIGLKYFKKFSDERSVFGGRIIVWKVDWEGKEKNIIEAPEPEIEEEKEIDDTINKINTSESEAIEEINTNQSENEEVEMDINESNGSQETDINGSNSSQNIQ